MIVIGFLVFIVFYKILLLIFIWDKWGRFGDYKGDFVNLCCGVYVDCLIFVLKIFIWDIFFFLC